MESIIERINQIDPTVLSNAGWSDPHGYLNRAYRFLSNMPTGQTFSVEKLADKVELFTLVISLYIHETTYCRVSFLKEDLKDFRKL